MRTLRTVQLGLVVLVTAVGCARVGRSSPSSPLQIGCTASMTPYLRTSVHFDRSNTADPRNPYSPQEWEKFIDEVLIRFIPAGGSLYDNTGWWRRPNGTTFRGIGRTMVVWAPVADSTAHRAGVDSVVAQIKDRYRHRVVFREEERVCEAAH